MAQQQEQHEAKYYTVEDDKVRCGLCPHSCLIAEGRTGFCHARKNVQGKLVTLVYGKPCSLNVDPVEKKPLFHFLPNTNIFSIGTLGCNLRCKHCQNDSISQVTDIESHPQQYYSPEQIVALAIKRGCHSIAFTYNEPSIFFEYALDVAKLAKAKGLKTVMVTNGFINPEPLDELYEYIDAANVDLKAFTERFYKDVCAATLTGVLETLQRLRERHPQVWLELTYLVIPGQNDDPAELEQATKWVAERLGPDTVFHISRFFPRFQMRSVHATSEGSLVEAQASAKRHLRYVYVGNILINDAENTHCPSCGAPLIVREGYAVGFTKNWQDGACTCGTKIPGVWH
eukprot:TRINITY_DN18878_c0_g1_i1.p1 TRINITY_DN18878_c0_g1~~TRINITY_DN18878_c0_g1_i1.p1  ORF type:complete len:360 (+),score=106.15 TRINITY_DN18878_c0_g1_i1:52-1080(+)